LEQQPSLSWPLSLVADAAAEEMLARSAQSADRNGDNSSGRQSAEDLAVAESSSGGGSSSADRERAAPEKRPSGVQLAAVAKARRLAKGSMECQGVKYVRRRKYEHESFPSRLYRLVQEAVERGEDHIVRFAEVGVGFEIVDPKAFVKEVLPMYFRHARMSSFKRQLSLYGFEKMDKSPTTPPQQQQQPAERATSVGSDAASHASSSSSEAVDGVATRWYHERFVRGRPELCTSIRRVSDLLDECSVGAAAAAGARPVT
jgi:hypothetical protein